MTRKTIRRLLTPTVAMPVALTALVATAPGAIAGGPDLATFHGGYVTSCSLPVESGTNKPADGAYTCFHTATSERSVGCANVMINGRVSVASYTCEADLTYGRTQGFADANDVGWTCVNGLGSGTFSYTEERGTTPLVFGVWLELIDGTLHINGSRWDEGSARLIVVRAAIPATCSRYSDIPTGYSGTVTPV